LPPSIGTHERVGDLGNHQLHFIAALRKALLFRAQPEQFSAQTTDTELGLITHNKVDDDKADAADQEYLQHGGLLLLVRCGRRTPQLRLEQNQSSPDDLDVSLQAQAMSINLLLKEFLGLQDLVLRGFLRVDLASLGVNFLDEVVLACNRGRVAEYLAFETMQRLTQVICASGQPLQFGSDLCDLRCRDSLNALYRVLHGFGMGPAPQGILLQTEFLGTLLITEQELGEDGDQPDDDNCENPYHGVCPRRSVRVAGDGSRVELTA
jgi:hypothetical protein